MRYTASAVLVTMIAAASPMLGGASQSARETTNPGLAPVTIYVTETDKGIKYTMWQTTIDAGQSNLLVASALQRGEIAIFRVTNKGKKPHNFSAFGKTTRKLDPGGKGHFKVALLYRGRYPYESTLDKANPAFRGVLIVY
jgi:hypothetical protein